MVDGKREVREAWHADIPGGVIGPATVSADGKTVYAFSRIGKLVACRRRPGRRSGPTTTATPVSPRSPRPPTGTSSRRAPLPGPVTMLADRGDRAEKVWSRTDLKTASLGALTNSGNRVDRRPHRGRRTGADRGLRRRRQDPPDAATARGQGLHDGCGRLTEGARSPLPPTSARFTSSTRRSRSGTSPAVASDLAGLAPPGSQMKATPARRSA